MSSSMKIQPLSSNNEERAETINKLARESKLVNVLSDDEGKFYATVKDSVNEIHPTTGLPVLHDWGVLFYLLYTDIFSFNCFI